MQRVSGSLVHPLAFFSAKLNSAEAKYSAFDRELLACALAVKHFCWMLEGRSFCIYTDHKPLCFALHPVADSCSARQQRHLSFLAEYTSDIRHLPGKENVVADALSRPAAAVVPPSSEAVPWAELAVAQRGCPATAALAASDALRVEQELAHPGVRATQRMVASQFVWCGCVADIARWCQECQICGRGKISLQ